MAYTGVGGSVVSVGYCGFDCWVAAKLFFFFVLCFLPFNYFVPRLRIWEFFLHHNRQLASAGLF